MATDAPEDQALPEPSPCTACRGTGKVISNLGGSPSTIDCPWCEGTGQFIPEHDAQARHRSEAPEADQTASSEGEGSAEPA